MAGADDKEDKWFYPMIIRKKRWNKSERTQTVSKIWFRRIFKRKELTFLDSNPYYESILKEKTESILGVMLPVNDTKDDTEYDSDVTNLYESD